MIRKWLFLGLTAMLATVVVYLLIQGRREEKKQKEAALHPVEVITESKPSATRIIAPREIEILEEKLDLAPAQESAGQAAGFDAKHTFVVRNAGSASCKNPRIRIVYYGRNGKVLDTRTRELPAASLPPGESTILDMVEPNAPPDSVKAKSNIVSVDLVSPSKQGK
jgi:hypothetical protein